MSAAHSAQKATLEQAMQTANDMTNKVREVKDQTAQAQMKYREAETRVATAKDLQLQIEESVRAKKKLESQYKELTESPFFKGQSVDENGANLLIVIFL